MTWNGSEGQLCSWPRKHARVEKWSIWAALNVVINNAKLQSCQQTSGGQGGARHCTNCSYEARKHTAGLGPAGLITCKNSTAREGSSRNKSRCAHALFTDGCWSQRSVVALATSSGEHIKQDTAVLHGLSPLGSLASRAGVFFVCRW